MLMMIMMRMMMMIIVDDNDDDANNGHDGDHDHMTLHVLLFMTTLQEVSFRG